LAKELKWKVIADTRTGRANLKKFRKSQDDVTSGMRRQGRQAKALGSSFGSLRKMVLLLGGTAGLVMLSKSFLKAADTAERYLVRLKVLLGSVEEGTRMFEEMRMFAAKVPFEYENIMNSAARLSTVLKGGVDEVKEWMPLIADIAAAFAMPVEQAADQTARMFSSGVGAARQFRIRGVQEMLGLADGVERTSQQIKDKMMEAWKDSASRFRGATEEMKKTWFGVTSMMSDKWFFFRTMVMDAGPFRMLKGFIGSINDELDRAMSSGKMQEWANTMGGAVIEIMKRVSLGAGAIADTVGVVLVRSISAIWKGFVGLPPWLQEIGIVGALMFGTRGAITIGAITMALGKLKEITDSEEELSESLGKQQQILDEYEESLDKIKNRYEELSSVEKAGIKLSGGRAEKIEFLNKLMEEQEKTVLKLKIKLATLYPEGEGKDFLDLLDDTTRKMNEMESSAGGFSLLESIGLISKDRPISDWLKETWEQIESFKDKVQTAGKEKPATPIPEAFIGPPAPKPEDLEKGRKQIEDYNKAIEDMALQSRETQIQTYATGWAQMDAMRRLELDKLQSHYEKELEIYGSHEDARTVLTEEWNAKRFEINQKWTEKGLELAEQEAERRKQIQASTFSEISSILGGYSSLFMQMSQAGMQASKEYFEVYKGIQVAQAFIDAYRAYTKAFTDYPAPVAPYMAAAHLGMAMLKVNMIMAQQPPQFKEGGIAVGPSSGYLAELHGKEAIIPLSGGKVPVVIHGGGMGGGQVIHQEIHFDGNYMDQETLLRQIESVSASVVYRLAPDAIVNDYFNDGVTRSMIKMGV